jgi:alkyl hydroperoxide reductase subunit AhpC
MESKCQCGPACKCGPNCSCGAAANCCKPSYKWTSKAVIRRPAPAFDAMSWNNGFKKVKLSDYKGKYVVLFFWPLDFTFVCPTEICQFSDQAKNFREIGCEVVGCSIDSQFTHMEYTRKDRKKGGLGKMDIPMIADITKQIAKDYGCLVDHGDDEGVAYRATYIIDTEGILRHISISDLPVGRNVDEVLRLVKAFQYTDEFGEVCPAQWQPGKKTMKPEADHEKNAAVFEDL